ncbi:PfkB family carbohydrate kinase [Devosia sp.]|uniref:PfkB family carbohydrate kinase n=1 Tax=Devosia sp. TaxID=1871048 RepID=UPI003BAB6EBC
MPKILCVGALTMDTIFRLEALPAGPGKVIPLDAVEVAEGMAAAQAATIARLGGESALWASAGDDAIGDRLVKQISAEGVDCSLVRRVAGGRSGFSSILMDRGGSTIIVPRYDPSLMESPAAAPDLAGLDAVMVDVRWPGAARLALEAARAAGIPGILDADMASLDILQSLVPLASHVVASEGAGRVLTGATDPKAAAEELMSLHSGFVAVTAGANGCWWSDKGAVRHTPAPLVEAIDTLAAGDVFHAAFALLLAEGRPMAEIMRFASAAAAIKCMRFGGRLGAPDRAEVEAFLRQ